MRIDLPANDMWTLVCNEYRAALPFHDIALNIQLYPGYSVGLFEITNGLAELFSHKKTIAVVESAEPIFASIVVPFSQEGYTIKSLKPADMESPSTWLPEIEKDLLFVLMATDDPVTGRFYDLSAMNEALKDKRIFRISLSHSSYHTQPLTRPLPFEVKVLSLTPDRALMLGGERARVQPTLTNNLPWQMINAPQVFSDLEIYSEEKLREWRVAIETFESNLPAGFVPYFKKGSEDRIWDRAAIYNKAFDGSAVITEVARELNVALVAPSQSSALETTSPCRWENPRFAEWLSARGESDDVIRGMVLISAEQLAFSTCEQIRVALERAAKKIERMQLGH